MSRLASLMAVVWASVFTVHAQDLPWIPLYTVQVEDLDQISMDNKEAVFYADKSGNIFKIDEQGILVNQYSPRLQTKPQQLEAFWTLNLFLFSAQNQRCTLLDIHLNVISEHDIKHEEIGIVRAATMGNNNIFWFFDETDLSLVQFDYRRNLVLQDQPLSLLSAQERLDVLEIKERGNLVYLNVKNQGVYIFDNQGNYLKKIDLQLRQKLSIYDGHLYYMNEDFIYRINVFSGREEKFKSPGESFDKVLVSANKVVFYSGSAVSAYARPGMMD